MLPVKADIPATQNRFVPGARRSFFCRMKCKTISTTIKVEADTTTGAATGYPCRKSPTFADRRYVVTHCTGYLRSWTPSNQSDENESENCDVSCLVAIGRAQCDVIRSETINDVDVRQMEFVSRHTRDLKFLYVDQRATMYIGYLSQELIGTSGYEYYHQDDVAHLAEIHKQVLKSNKEIETAVYRFRTKDSSFVYLKTKWKVFTNPWTRDFEFLIAVNYLVPCPPYVDLAEFQDAQSSSGTSEAHKNHEAISLLASLPTSTEATSFLKFNHIGAVEIGQEVANSKETERMNRPLESMPLSLFGDVIGSSTSMGSCWNSYFGSPTTNESAESEVIDSIMGRDMTLASHHNSISNESNDETAMAVIMSLLEADAGLGGSVDFSGLPWSME